MPNVPPLMASRPLGTERAQLDPWGLFDDLPANVSVVDARERPIYANRCWQATFNPGGVPLDDVDLAAVVHPDDVAGARDAWSEATSSGSHFAYRYRVRGARGQYRWFAVTASPTVPSIGGDWQYACVATDIDDAFRYEAYFSLLAVIGAVVSSATDMDAACARIGESIVPQVGASFVVYRPDADGELVPRTIVGIDESRAVVFRELWRTYPAPSRRFVDLAVATGEPVVIPSLSPQTQADFAVDDAHLRLLRAYDARDIILASIRGRDELHGVLEIGAAPDLGREFGDAEGRLVREIAREIAQAFDAVALATEGRRAADDLRFLAQVGENMVESLDLTSRLERFVHAVVPRLADWATVNLVQNDGALETLAIAHRDPAKAEIAARLRGPYYGDRDANYGTPIALRSGRPRLLTGVDERFLREHLRPETYDDVRALGADSAFVVPLMSNGEVYGTLSAMRVASERPFTENDMWLIEELARRAAVAIDNARRFARHTTVAEAFQSASLPDALPHHRGAAFSAFYAPGQHEATVGGDWFDAFALPDGRLVVSIGDVCGSGLAAAVIMGSVRQLIRGAAQLQADPSVILDAADRALRTQTPQTLVTAFVGILDLERAVCSYASAGHPTPLLAADGVVSELRSAPSLPLGLRDAGEPESQTCRFEDGALLVLYTDGLTESTRDVIAGEAALRTALADPTLRDAPDIARAIHDRLLPDGAHDDVAILAVRLRVGA
ncbi:MAG: hypothetical protein NVS4B5_11990 [Vulcanimicrobiaceae bacterium]